MKNNPQIPAFTVSQIVQISGVIQDILNERYVRLMEEAKTEPFSERQVLLAGDVERIFLNNLIFEIQSKLNTL